MDNPFYLEEKNQMPLPGDLAKVSTDICFETMWDLLNKIKDMPDIQEMSGPEVVEWIMEGLAQYNEKRRYS